MKESVLSFLIIIDKCDGKTN